MEKLGDRPGRSSSLPPLTRKPEGTGNPQPVSVVKSVPFKLRPRQKQKKLQKALSTPTQAEQREEPPFSDFILAESEYSPLFFCSRVRVGDESPKLPSFGDPELFDNVFLKSYTSGQPRYMRVYGDSLLRTVTYEVLADLFGNHNSFAILQTLSFAVSNAFYDRLISHYCLEKLCSHHERVLKSSKHVTRMRGDVLESYIAAIMMDISRSGEGYCEIKNWLHQILSLRLRPVLQNGTYINNQRENPWWLSCRVQPQSPGRMMDQSQLKSVFSARGVTSALQARHEEFRRVLFKKMEEIFIQVASLPQTTDPSMFKVFWTSMKTYLGNFCEVHRGGEYQKVLLYYYRVRPVLDLLTLSRMFPSSLGILGLHLTISVYCYRIKILILESMKRLPKN